MKTTTQQIERKNKSKPELVQRYEEGIGICVTLATTEALLQLAVTLQIAPMPIAERAIQSYLKFMREYAELAHAMPRFKNCNSSLGTLRRNLSDALVVACNISGLDPSQVADSAISTYTRYAEEIQARHPDSWHFIEESPGEIDACQIACVLSLASQSAEQAFKSVLTDVMSQPFGVACGKLHGILALIMHHPGFDHERLALEMIVEGAARIGASC